MVNQGRRLGGSMPTDRARGRAGGDLGSARQGRVAGDMLAAAL